MTLKACIFYPKPLSPQMLRVQEDIGIDTKGWFDSNVPMLLGTNTHWGASENFTSNFVSLEAHLVPGPSPFTIGREEDQFQNPSAALKMRYIPSILLGAEWIKVPSFETQILSKTSYASIGNSRNTGLSYTFAGPKEKTVYFNEITLALLLLNIRIYPPIGPEMGWLNCSCSFGFEGVLGVVTHDLFHI
ncbi:hypothetical protein DSO57_1016667 [Entomophthora muscae]|uniref:Uncharacterized protein n=1 Tax=Entomophthora muscae TaxID=34485 RepID=A0ACC2TG42_9FUNG|nr:hypothetical protein DSO57_1016667 [Entomophthora muscae]